MIYDKIFGLEVKILKNVYDFHIFILYFPKYIFFLFLKFKLT